MGMPAVPRPRHAREDCWGVGGAQFRGGGGDKGGDMGQARGTVSGPGVDVCARCSPRGSPAAQGRPGTIPRAAPVSRPGLYDVGPLRWHFYRKVFCCCDCGLNLSRCASYLARLS